MGGQGARASTRAPVHMLTNARACVGSQRAWAMLWHATRPLHVRTGNVGRRGRGGEIQKGNKRWIAALARTHAYARTRDAIRAYQVGAQNSRLDNHSRTKSERKNGAEFR